MSRTVIPRPYSATMRSLSPCRRRAPLGTICGSKVEFRSRGTSSSTAPMSVWTRLGDVPLRELPDPRPAASPLS
jgi:hypothetical protein